MTSYHNLSKTIQEKIKIDNGLEKVNDPAIRRNPEKDRANLHRPSFVRDVEKILHCPY